MTKSISGSIFADGRNNKLIIQVHGKRVFTGLIDTPANRKVAEKLQFKLLLDHLGLGEETNRLTIKKAFEEFIDIHCNRLELKTVRSYKLAYRTILKQDAKLTVANLEKEIHSFIRSFKGSDATFNIYLRSIQVFINYCIKRKYIPLLPAYKDYKRPSSDKEIKVFTEAEVKAIIEHFNKTDKEFAFLIRLLVQTGLRISEALDLDVSQIREDRLLIPNKINKNRPEIVYISPDIREMLLTLGNPKIFRWKVSSYSRINRTLRTALKDLGIVDDRSFHEFRKTYLKKLIDAGTPVEIAQKLMRHKSINVTIKFYTYIQDSELKGYQSKVQV
jgi:integrase/recombinase XerD